MGCGAAGLIPDRRSLDSESNDPVGRPLEVLRRLRDDIDRRVRHLLIELEVFTGRSAGAPTAVN